MQLKIKIFGSNKKQDVVLIHGTGAKAQMWLPQIKLLLQHGYRCLVPDLRGHGETDEPGEKTDIHVHMQDLLETLESQSISFPAVFVGHSLGSIIALELALRKPEMFSKILAVSMPGKVPGLTVSTFKLLLGWPYRSIKGTLIHKNLAWRERVLISTNHHSLSQIVENFAHLNYTNTPPQVTCPVHFAVGRLDLIAPFYHVIQMHKALPDSTLKIIEWAGHNCMDSQPQEFNRWLLEKISN